MAFLAVVAILFCMLLTPERQPGPNVLRYYVKLYSEEESKHMKELASNGDADAAMGLYQHFRVSGEDPEQANYYYSLARKLEGSGRK